MLDKAIYNKITDYCASRERCGSDVKRKLRMLGVSSADMDIYIQQMKENGFLNEERYVKIFVEWGLRKKWGKQKIKAALAVKGLPVIFVKKYLDRVEEKDYTEILEQLIKKKRAAIRNVSPKEANVKLIRFLLSRGFEIGIIHEAIKNY